MERSGWQPSPPIRASTAGAVSTVAVEPEPIIDDVPVAPVDSGPSAPPPLAPLTSTPDRANPDEVTRTLANLADLRDRGAISAEDYEAKKADLLSRL
jgi:hypothetical protein